MNTPLSWIKAYVPELSCTPQEYADAMTLSGSKVEGYERLDKNLDKIVVGKILKIERHPNADKLVVCQVQVSEEGEILQIVTGAANVREGDLVPVVLDGGRVAASAHGGEPHPDGIQIKKGKLRGVESCGMLCSIEELGASRDLFPDAAEDGIFILSDSPECRDARIGESVPRLLGLDDVVFEYEITSNRVDCFSVLGIAREAAATFGKPFLPPKIPETGNGESAGDYVSVEVEDGSLCSRYVARVVRNVRLAPSPGWMRRRLSAAGIRPINNIVDITNYVMEELGQPMHAYDLDTIAGRKIVVRRARDGERFQTLDEQERTLDSSTLMICDGEKAVGIAGIMGGENSKITGSVSTLLLEAACFDGTSIRLSGKRLGMRTEAQAMFEKGLDPNNAKIAMDRACQLIEELGAGEVVGGAVDIYPNPRKPGRVAYDAGKINALLGTGIPEAEMLGYFRKVGLEADEESKEVIVPTWRQDIHCLADLAEEVARFYGYDNIPMTLPRGEAMGGKLSHKLAVERRARGMAEHYGFSEGMTYSFESPKVFDRLLLAKDDPLRKAIVIANPLGEDYSIMRTLPLNGMLSSLSLNYNRRNKSARLYEIGNVYLPKELPLASLPDERTQMTLGMYGKGDFFDMKGAVEGILEACGLAGRKSYEPDVERPFLHPGRKAGIWHEGKEIGYLGEVHPQVCENYGIGTKAYVAVLDMPQVVERSGHAAKFRPIAKFPVVTRDISMVARKDILAGQIEEVIRKRGGKLLESCVLFDIYEGEQIQPGYRSLAYAISFRSDERTLEEKDVAAAMKKILNGLSELGIELRQ